MDYSFNTDVAVEVGVEAAVIFQNIAFWCQKNAANEKHFHDGNYWTYNSVKAWHDLMPFFSEKKIPRLVQKLKDCGLIETGNYNRVGYDRTLWYAVTAKGWKLLSLDVPPFLKIEKCISQNQEMHLPESRNGFPEIEEPIPDINTDINKEEEEEAWQEVATCYQNNIRPICGEIERDELYDFFTEYGKEWVIASIHESVKNDVRKRSYMKSVLERWKRDGFKSDSRKKGSTPSKEPQRELTAEEREANYWKGIQAAIERNRADEERRRQESERLNHDPYSRSSGVRC